jgi:hypothetical protein
MHVTSPGRNLYRRRGGETGKGPARIDGRNPGSTGDVANYALDLFLFWAAAPPHPDERWAALAPHGKVCEVAGEFAPQRGTYLPSNFGGRSRGEARHYGLPITKAIR